MAEDYLPIFRSTLEQVCVVWKEKHSQHWGFIAYVDDASVQRAHSFFQEILLDNKAFPESPGPFKVAAAFLVSAKKFVEFAFEALPGGDVDDKEHNLWVSRFIFKCLPGFLNQLKLDATGKHLEKHWDTPSMHYRLDFLNLIRWCEFPIDGPSEPPPPSKPSVDMLRANRLIMAMMLIIESCYYLSGETDIKCDVKDNVHINPDEMDASVVPDLFFDCSSPPSQN